MRYAYAAARPGFFDKATEDIRVLLSDVPLPDSARTDVFELIRLARDGKARVVEVLINAEGEPIAGGLFAPDFNGMVSIAGVHRFVGGTRERTRIAGRLQMESASSFVGVTFVYDATFSATIPRPPTEEELAAELASPPARAAEAYLAAIRQGDLVALASTVTAAAGSAFRAPDGAAGLATLRADFPPDSHVVRLIATGESRATATVEGHRNGIIIETTLQLVLEDGGWRVSP